MSLFFYPFLILLFYSCIGPEGHQDHEESIQLLNPGGQTIAGRFNTPDGFQRVFYDSNSFAYFLQHLPLKPSGYMVHYYNGDEKRNNNVAAAVVDITVGDKDLQQCADAVIRLRADYLRKSGREDEIVFNFTNGTPAYWAKWKDGYRCTISGNDVLWEQSAVPSETDQTFANYLETVFIYAGSLSLEKELITANISDIQPGDVFIQGGSPGHAVIVVDVAINDHGESLFMLAQSYMPAQDIHVLINPNVDGISPWYRLKEGEKLITPEWVFDANVLKRFP